MDVSRVFKAECVNVNSAKGAETAMGTYEYLFETVSWKIEAALFVVWMYGTGQLFALQSM